jgi:hypothetical protein
MENTPGMLPPTPKPAITRDTNSALYSGDADESSPNTALMPSATDSALRRPHASEAAPNTNPPTSMPTKMAADSTALAVFVYPSPPPPPSGPAAPQRSAVPEPSSAGRIKDRHSSSTASDAFARPSVRSASTWKRPKPRWLSSDSTLSREGFAGGNSSVSAFSSRGGAGTKTGESEPYIKWGLSRRIR